MSPGTSGGAGRATSRKQRGARRAGTRKGLSGALLTAAALAAASAVALLASGCGEAAASRQRDWNVVVVLGDTLRADHLGAYGYPRPTSPRLDAFAEANVLFADHRSQSPCTFPSVNSLLTSRSPQAFTGRATGVHSIPEGIPSLAEILAARGYATLAVSASPIVRATPSELNKVGGFGRGFDLFVDEECAWSDARCIQHTTAPWLPILREPFFLYLHYMDPHDPYAPPQGYERQFAPHRPRLADWARAGDPGPLADRVAAGQPHDQRNLTHLIDLYDDSVRYFDAMFGRLVDTLEGEGALDRTLIAVVSDHGEGFLENGHLLHCKSLYETELRTPWLLAVPGLEGPVRIEGPTANLDVVPTLLDLLGEELAPYGFEGRSLRHAIGRGEPLDDPVFAAWGGLRSATDGRHKLIVNVHARTAQLYDLAADPYESHDVADDEPEALRRLFAELEAWRRRVEPDGPELEGETVEDQLRALGYLR